jgi:hypothetical protein
MTSMDDTQGKAVIGAENGEVMEKTPTNSTVRTYSKPYDITVKDNAESRQRS